MDPFSDSAPYNGWHYGRDDRSLLLGGTSGTIDTTCLHRRNPTAVRHRCAQRCDSENEHSAVTVMVRIVMLQR